MPQHPGCRLTFLAALILAAAALPNLAGVALAQSNQAAPSVSDQPTTGTGAPVIRPQPDVHGRAGSGQGQQHGSDSASPGSTGGGVSTSDPAGSGPTMTNDGAPSATGGPASPSSTGQ